MIGDVGVLEIQVFLDGPVDIVDSQLRKPCLDFGQKIFISIIVRVNLPAQALAQSLGIELGVAVVLKIRPKTEAVLFLDDEALEERGGGRREKPGRRI